VEGGENVDEQEQHRAFEEAEASLVASSSVPCIKLAKAIFKTSTSRTGQAGRRRALQP
jgi:hypothetical protein